MRDAIAGFIYGISIAVIAPNIQWWQGGLILAIIVFGERFILVEE